MPTRTSGAVLMLIGAALLIGMLCQIAGWVVAAQTVAIVIGGGVTLLFGALIFFDP